MAAEPYRDLFVLLFAAGRLAVWLAVFAAVFAPIERIFALRRQKIFRKEFAVDLGYYFLNGLLPGLVLGAPISLAVLAIQRAIPGAAATLAPSQGRYGRGTVRVSLTILPSFMISASVFSGAARRPISSIGLPSTTRRSASAFSSMTPSLPG
jgi:hypothetical protein